MAETDTTLIADYNSFLKEWYIDMIHKARQEKVVFLDEEVIKFDHEHVAGKYALIPVEFQSFNGVGNRAENGAMPIPDAGQYDVAKVSLVNSFAVMQMSLQLMKASEGDRAAFNPALAQQMGSTTTAWTRDLNRQVLGDGLAILALSDSSWTDGDTDAKDIDCAWGIDNTDARSNGNGDLFVSENLRINAFNGNTLITDGGANDDGVINITAYSRGSGATEATITMDDSGTGAAGYKIVRDGNKANGATGSYEANGLMSLLDDGTVAATFQNIAVATRPDWKAWVHYGDTPGTVEALTRSRLNKPWKDITMRGSGKVDFLFGGMDTQETYMELADSMGLVTNMIKLDVAGNWEGPEYRGVPFIADPIYPETRIEYINKAALAIYENEPADWIPGDVGVLQKVAGYANYNAELAWFWQFGIRNRSHVGSLRDIELVT